jgi:hypothetical protein
MWNLKKSRIVSAAQGAIELTDAELTAMHLGADPALSWQITPEAWLNLRKRRDGLGNDLVQVKPLPMQMFGRNIEIVQPAFYRQSRLRIGTVGDWFEVRS